jgi:hypothetical protein
MSERRLTDEQIAGLQRIIDGDDGVRPIMFPWMSHALTELRARRAADLTAEDVEALDGLAGFLRARFHSSHIRDAQLAVLDKLLRGVK